MENPEEVLQALDEFQKMRPSEIPRELEEYLCFVAKTGDPVYQWSLIKPLFREKLVRVMTDFYESCPTLDLATSPNIEHFNYDIMKCNLLELLESFANAPFTVQRVCELLTAPRKEYNRVDKFMRAIEKNILVVSTREPGPAARRSENGDSMVNGTIDEEIPTTQQSHEVEMESWVKDCTMDSNVSSVFVPATKKYDSPTNSETTTTTTPEKITTKDNLPEDNCPSIVQEKDDNCTKNDIVDSNLISTALTSSTNDSLTCPTNGQTLPANSEEIPQSIVADVPEAIMNEDTSSQPSLESENDDNESNRKLQTTFQSKDFDKIDEKSQDEQKKNTDETVVAHEELENNQEKKSEIIEHNEKIDKQEEGESEHSDNIDETAISADESILEKRPRLDDVIITAAVETEIPKESNLSVITTPKEEIKEEEVSVNEEEKKEIESDEPVEEIKKDIVTKPIESETNPIVTESPSSNISEVLPTEGESKTEEITQEITTENPKPIIEEPPFEEEKTQSSEKQTEQESSNIVIEEAMDDDVKSASILIPDPIPIIEEPKDEPNVQITAVENLEFSESTKTEITESVNLDSSENVEATIINTEMTETVENKLESSISIDDVQETNSEEMEKIEPAESMEVDGEDSSSVLLQQDEPMEEESPDQTRS